MVDAKDDVVQLAVRLELFDEFCRRGRPGTHSEGHVPLLGSKDEPVTDLEELLLRDIAARELGQVPARTDHELPEHAYVLDLNLGQQNLRLGITLVLLHVDLGDLILSNRLVKLHLILRLN